MRTLHVIIAASAATWIGCTAPEPPETPEPPAPEIAPSPRATEETLERLTGEWGFTGGTEERGRLAEEIDGLVEQMSVVTRGIARSRLTTANVIPEQVTITRSGDQLTIVFDGQSYTAALDGAPVEVTGATGEALTMRLRSTPDGIEQRFTGEDGGRANVFLPREDGGMQISVRVFSERLPDDLRYVLTYGRDEMSGT